MTNWATAFIPATAVPANFNLDSMLGSGGIFRTDLTLTSFLDLFSPVSPDLLQNKRSRWAKYLDAATAGDIWAKEPFESPYPPTYFHYHDPIFDRLQSSYDDVIDVNSSLNSYDGRDSIVSRTASRLAVTGFHTCV